MGRRTDPSDIFSERAGGGTSRAALTAFMLISTEQLASQLNDPSCVIFDCRHDLGDHGKGAKLYREGHITGAHFAPVETVLSGAKTGSNGRHPLPVPAELAVFFASHGVTPETKIVAYDDAGGLYAARLWWPARWIGLNNVMLLNGGWPKWIAEGRAVSAVVPSVTAAATCAVHADTAQVWSTADVLSQLGNPSFALIDARAGERYRGEVEPMDAVAGHIPGALNRFYKTNLQADLTFRPRDEVRREFQMLIGARAVEHVGHQCGSGITACANIFAMEYAGLSGSKLYAGSWSEWVSDRSRPVARGTDC